MTPLFTIKKGLKLVLASGSPRRNALLASLGLGFTIRIPEVEEPAPPKGIAPQAYAMELARLKGEAVLSTLSQNNILILSADTIVVCDGTILGKPHDTDDAARMLNLLNGKVHEVVTAFYLATKDGKVSILEADRAIVRFGRWPEEALRAYAQSGEPMDKAGSYAIQDQGSFLVEYIEGAWTTIAGLPLAKITAKLLEAGLIEPNDVPPASGI